MHSPPCNTLLSTYHDRKISTSASHGPLVFSLLDSFEYIAAGRIVSMRQKKHILPIDP